MDWREIMFRFCKQTMARRDIMFRECKQTMDRRDIIFWWQLYSGKFKLCDFKLLLAHFKKHKINCIFLFTFMKQLKPIRDENYREKDQEWLKGLGFELPQNNKIKFLEKNMKKTSKKSKKNYFFVKKYQKVLKCSKF